MTDGCVDRMCVVDRWWGLFGARRVEIATQPDRSEEGREEKGVDREIYGTDPGLNGWLQTRMV